LRGDAFGLNCNTSLKERNGLTRSTRDRPGLNGHRKHIRCDLDREMVGLFKPPLALLLKWPVDVGVLEDVDAVQDVMQHGSTSESAAIAARVEPSKTCSSC